METTNKDADLMGYTPPLSLWGLVEQNIAVHEQDEIKSMLGIAMVEETAELHEELRTFLDIWRDCRQETNMMTTTNKRLPEPPGIRDRLIQEIKFFIENVKEKAKDIGSEERHVMKKYNQKVISYATKNDIHTGSGEPFSRPPSMIGKDGRETPLCRQSSPASDMASTSTWSTMSEDIECMADKLNILKLDEVVQHLRSYLAEEKDILIQDIRFLQECIEEENRAAENIHQTEEPTISELREERLKLEKDMLSETFRNQVVLNSGLAINHQTLKSSIERTRTAVVPRTGPVKAVHTSAPDGIVLTGNVPESVVTKAQQRLLDEAKEYKKKCAGASQKLVKIGTLSANQLADTVTKTADQRDNGTVVLRSAGSTGRPSSAHRFRSMVMNLRTMGDDS